MGRQLPSGANAGGGGGAVTSVAGRTGDVTLAEADITSLVADLALKAPLASPTLTGTPAAPTAAQGTNTTQIATTAMVHSEAVLLAPLASPTLTGTPAAPTAAQGTNTTQVATTAMVHSEAALLATLASPTFTGTPAAPTAAAATSTTQLATTAMVQAAIAAQIGAVGGFAKIIKRTADSSTISTQATPQSDDTLLWAVGATDRWFFQAFLTFTQANSSGSATTADLKIGFSVPTNTTMQWGGLGTNTNATGMSGYGYSTTSSSPNVILTQSGTLSLGGNVGTYGVGLAGYVNGVDTAGNVTLQWSQNTSDASTLLIAKNSMIIAWRIA